MAVDDRTRLNLHRKLEAVLGPEEAATLMAHLPPVTWQDVATKDDLRLLGGDLRTEMAVLRTEMADLRTDLRTEMADLRTEFRTEMADLRIEVRTGLADLRTEFRTELAAAIDRQTRWMVMFICAWSTVVVGAVRLLF